MFGHSVEKDGKALSDEKQTIQTSLFAMLKDFLKSPTPEELHSVLAYILSAGEEQQVCFFVCCLRELNCVLQIYPPWSSTPPYLFLCFGIRVLPNSSCDLLSYPPYFLALCLPSSLFSSWFSHFSIRSWGPWMCCMNSWGAALLVSMCRLCYWSGAWSSCTAYCSLQALEMKPEREFSGWEQLTGPLRHLSMWYVVKTAEIFFFSQFPFLILQVLYKILKSERVSERNKQRIKLKDFGYLGLVCCLDDIPVTMTTVRCLYEQVLATGNVKTFQWVEFPWNGWQKGPLYVSKPLKMCFSLTVNKQKSKFKMELKKFKKQITQKCHRGLIVIIRFIQFGDALF